ncbi:hypothetical protein ACFLZ3_02730 [Candidatus Omnitrophota bacterium]
MYKKIKLPFRLKRSVLALGSQTKNRICFAAGDYAYLSPVHGDLNDPDDLAHFKQDVKRFLKKKPRILVHDLHPDYQSTKYAQELSGLGLRLQGVQHHHAHIASCMAENGLKNKRVIGVAFDGTGLGEDQAIWGAEFLICDYKGFTRRAHLREIPLVGQEQAVVEPWRLAAIWLYLAKGERFLDSGIGLANKIDKRKWQVLKKMYLSGFNSPPASSMGRLFDAAASLVLSRTRADFEAQLAIELEKKASCSVRDEQTYEFRIIRKNKSYILDPLPLFKGILSDLKRKRPAGLIAYRFHATVADMISKICLLLRRDTGIKRIVLSGGVFQNNLLSALAKERLRQSGFKVLMHRDSSCNDSGIALGEAVSVGAHR